jgi:hypothetical protein
MAADPTATLALAVRAEQLAEYLRAATRVAARSTGSWRYGCYEDLVLQRGRSMPGQRRPAGVPRGPSGECFRNAGRLAMRGHRYAEGFALPEHGVPVLHAWCLDGRGRVIDPTWEVPERAVYFGVPLPIELVLTASLRHGSWGVFGNDHHDDFRLLRGGLAAEDPTGPGGRGGRHRPLSHGHVSPAATPEPPGL